jgi:hypothetical protein
MAVNISTVKSIVREVAAVLGVIIALTNELHLPTSVRATVLGISGSLLAIDHAVSKVLDPSTSIAVTNSPTKGV